MQAGEASQGCKLTGMLRTTACAAALGLLLLAAAPSATDAVAARIQAAYDAQCNDLLHDDFTSLQSTFSPSFTASQNGQTVTRDDVITGLKAFAARGTITKCSTSVQSAQEESNVVIAVVTQQLGGTVTGGKTSVPIEIDAGRRDIWSDNSGALLETTFSSIWSRIYVNGKLQQESGNPPGSSPSSSPAPQATP